MIVKVQRPLYPFDAPWLAYNEDRTVTFEFTPKPALIRKMGKRVKAYVELELSDDGIIVHRIVEDQPW